jgi:hypothetical protein
VRKNPPVKINPIFTGHGVASNKIMRAFYLNIIDPLGWKRLNGDDFVPEDGALLLGLGRLSLG